MTSASVLYYGDNLDVLRQHIADASVDLIYLDPPFNSNANYNVLFAEQDGSRAAAQIQAFEDTWRWDQAAVFDYEQTVERGGHVADALMAMRTFLGGNNMLSYLSMMAPRLVELRRVLKVDFRTSDASRRGTHSGPGGQRLRHRSSPSTTSSVKLWSSVTSSRSRRALSKSGR